MSHTNRTNRQELSKLFDQFCSLWAEGQHATMQIQSMGNGKAKARLEIELGKPGEPFPSEPAGYRRGTPRGGASRPQRHHQQASLPVQGHPGRTRNRRRRRGPAAVARSKARAAAFQASLAAASSGAGPTPPSGATGMAPPPPPPATAATRLIRVVARQTRYRPSFTQLDGGEEEEEEEEEEVE